MATFMTFKEKCANCLTSDNLLLRRTENMKVFIFLFLHFCNNVMCDAAMSCVWQPACTPQNYCINIRKHTKWANICPYIF